MLTIAQNRFYQNCLDFMNATKSSIEISVIVPTIVSHLSIKTTLASLLTSIPKTANYEILVVDNRNEIDQNRGIDLVDLCASVSKQITVLWEPKPGLTAARHAGVLKSKGNILSFIDDDVLVNPDWYTELEHVFSNDACALAGGPSIPLFESQVPNWLWRMYVAAPSGGWMCHWLTLLDIPTDVDGFDPRYVWGLNFSIRKSVLMEVGGFNPDLFPKDLSRFQGNGETGLALRLIESGYSAQFRQKLMVRHRIPSARLSYSYFNKRSYFQGISDSFQQIRSRNIDKKNKISMNELYRFNRVGFIFFRLVPKIIGPTFNSFRFFPSLSALLLKVSMFCEIQNGFWFHQKAVRKDPELDVWVKKHDYF
jgi:glycosyltransferase involved in cell wall biosynthesis